MNKEPSYPSFFFFFLFFFCQNSSPTSRTPKVKKTQIQGNFMDKILKKYHKPPLLSREQIHVTHAYRHTHQLQKKRDFLLGFSARIKKIFFLKQKEKHQHKEGHGGLLDEIGGTNFWFGFPLFVLVKSVKKTAT